MTRTADCSSLNDDDSGLILFDAASLETKCASITPSPLKRGQAFCLLQSASDLPITYSVAYLKLRVRPVLLEQRVREGGRDFGGGEEHTGGGGRERGVY
jgi:hypothetical protein